MNVIFKRWKGKVGCLIVTTSSGAYTVDAPNYLSDLLPHFWDVVLDVKATVVGGNLKINWVEFEKHYKHHTDHKADEDEQIERNNSIEFGFQRDSWMDGSRYIGFYARENEGFGSHSGHDNYDDEAHA